MICGDILQELRKDKGMTQTEVAKVLHVVPSTISNYETGISQPESDMIERLADFYNVNIDYLYNRTRISTPLRDLEKKIMMKFGHINYEDLVLLNKEDQEIIKLLIDRFLKS